MCPFSPYRWRTPGPGENEFSQLDAFSSQARAGAARSMVELAGAAKRREPDSGLSKRSARTERPNQSQSPHEQALREAIDPAAPLRLLATHLPLEHALEFALARHRLHLAVLHRPDDAGERELMAA